MKSILLLLFITFTNAQVQAQGMFDKLKKVASGVSSKEILSTKFIWLIDF